MDYLQSIPLTLNPRSTGAVAGSTNTFTTTVASECAIKGKFATSLGVLTNQAVGASGLATTDANTGAIYATIPINSTACVVFGVNAAGTLLGVQGPIINTLTGVTTTVGAFKDAPQFPVLPDDFCPIAYTVIRVAPSLTAGFIVASTSWAASGASCTTFKNVMSLPNRPQIA